MSRPGGSRREERRAARSLGAGELDRFFDLSSDLLCIADADGRFRRLNPAWERTLGIPRAELMAGGLLDFVHPDDAGNTRWAIERLAAQHDAVHFVSRLRCRDGSYRWLEWRAVPSGTRFHAAARDVTDRQQIETALWESAAETMDLYNHAPCGYHTLDADGVFRRVNDTELSWLGYAREEVVGRMRFPDLLAPGSLQVFEESFPRLKQGGAAHSLEFEMVRRDGSRLPVLMSATAVTDADGRYVMSRATVFDVTDRRRAEEQIRLNELRLESMLRIAQYRARDVQALLDYALDEALALTGSTVGGLYEHDEERGELRLRSWSKGGARDPAVTAARVPLALGQAGPWGEAVRRRRPVVANGGTALDPRTTGVPDGLVPVRRIMTAPVLDGDRIVAVVGVANKESDYDPSDARQLVLLMDSAWRVVERQRAEEVRQQAEREMRETLELKSQFISTVSHELRTPLTAIKESIEIVRDETAGTVSADAREFLDVARRNIDRLARLIHNVLSFQRLEAGSAVFDLRPQDVNRIVREVATAMAPLAAQKALEVSLTLDEALPRVECDRDQITQVLTNLVGNAIKFSDHGRVVVSTGASDDRFLATVSDDGCGIAPEDLPRLFEKFRQLGPWDERAAGGSGLGLAISKEIVERHGGSIWVESEPGAGTSVRFVLPIGAGARD